MEEMSPMFKFFSTLKPDNRIVELYTTIRTWLQREGHTTESAKRISGGPAEIWDARHRMVAEIEKLKKDLYNYGIFDQSEFNNYIEKRLKEVDKKFPLIDELDD